MQRSPQELKQIAQDYEDNLPLFQTTLDQLVGLIKSNFSGFDVKYGIKKLSSVISKMNRKDYPTIFEMPDIVRATLLVPIKFDLDEQLEKLKKVFKISNEGIEKKNDPTSGYKLAYHTNFFLNGVRCEIITYYSNKDPYKSESHKFYERTREGEILSPEEQLRARRIMTARDDIEAIREDRKRTHRQRKQTPPELAELGRRQRGNLTPDELLNLTRKFEKESLLSLTSIVKISQNIFNRLKKMASSEEEKEEVKLPEDAWKYFLKTPSAFMVDVKDLVTIRARPKGIQNAEKYMKMAYDGEGDKRKPISVSKLPNGKWKVEDGNSTTAIALKHKWKQMPVVEVEPEESEH